MAVDDMAHGLGCTALRVRQPACTDTGLTAHVGGVTVRLPAPRVDAPQPSAVELNPPRRAESIYKPDGSLPRSAGEDDVEWCVSRCASRTERAHGDLERALDAYGHNAKCVSADTVVERRNRHAVAD